jgi:hypothetical protein
MSCKGFKKIPSQVADTRHSGDLTHQERLNYVSAVLCLQHLPPRTPANVSAGARSRVSTWENRVDIEALFIQYDDFIVTHIQKTLQIHYTGNFLPWHRWFTYSYEKALRDECGYKGYQPVHRYPFHVWRHRQKLTATTVLGLAEICFCSSRFSHL